MSEKFNEKELLDGYVGQSQKTINDKNLLGDLLKKIEEKLKDFPGIGDKLADLILMIDLVRAYWSGEYKEAPVGTLVAIVAGLIYWVSPIDLIPDSIPGLGMLDDIAVLGFVINSVQDDLNAYRSWRNNNK